jgi:tetratricopeptide (TPR) repeat protein
MLALLRTDLEQAEGFVTFNGRAFDLPLIETRYVIALRERLRLRSMPHLDLLHMARRLWRRSLPDTRLSTVERQILGVERSQQDVPGAWIPSMYQEYLRSGDASEMARVIYHNTVDILSLVGLASDILERHQDARTASLTDAEALAIARWHASSGRSTSAETAFQKAVSSPDLELKLEALRRYGAELKRQDRKAEALPSWQRWHQLAPEDPRPCIELAMFFEWQAKDLEQARFWAQEALACLSHWPPGWRRDRAWSEIEHRLLRLARKLRIQR